MRFRMLLLHHILRRDCGAQLLGRVDMDKVVRLQLARMRPGIHILPHTDRGQWAVHAHRIHVPITAGPEVHFDVRSGCGSPMPDPIAT